MFFRRTFTTIRSAIYKTHGQPSNVVKIEENKIKEVKANEIIIKMLGASINPSDINMIEGTYSLLPPLPAVGGNEGVGTVISVGSNIKNLKLNDWVVPSNAGLGTWRSHIICNENDVMKINNDIPVEYAATLCVNPAAAYRMLEDFVTLKSGDVILQNGANSAVGQSVIQLAKARGVKTINIIRDRPNLKDTVKRLKDLGGDVVVTEEFAKSAEMRKIIADLPAPVLALNCVGGESATELARLLGNNGTLVTYGGMSKKPVTLSTSSLIFKNINVRGFWLSRWTKEHTVEERQKMIDHLSSLVKSKKLQLSLERKPFDELPSVISSYYEGHKDRKIVLTF